VYAVGFKVLTVMEYNAMQSGKKATVVSEGHIPSIFRVEE
jgi:hypothetical protein